MRKQFHNGKK